MFGLFKRLPHCDTLFKRYLDPWYLKEERRGMTRPDLYTIAAYNGKPLDVDEIQYLKPEVLGEMNNQVAGSIEAAKNDFQKVAKFDDFSVDVIDKIDKHYDKKRIIELIKENEPNDNTNPYLVTVCQFGSMLGEMFSRQPGYQWLYSYPYFNSIIVHQPTGTGVTVYDWAVKKFSSYGLDDGFAAKFQHAVKVIDSNDDRYQINVSTYNKQ